jgi:hypothetical protein
MPRRRKVNRSRAANCRDSHSCHSTDDRGRSLFQFPRDVAHPDALTADPVPIQPFVYTPLSAFRPAVISGLRTPSVRHRRHPRIPDSVRRTSFSAVRSFRHPDSVNIPSRGDQTCGHTSSPTHALIFRVSVIPVIVHVLPSVNSDHDRLHLICDRSTIRPDRST